MTTQLLADALPELPKAIFWARKSHGAGSSDRRPEAGATGAHDVIPYR